jgi:hypothetical protein
MKHRAWLKSVMKKYGVEQDPICADDGEIIAEPLFWFDAGDAKNACYAEEPMQAVWAFGAGNVSRANFCRAGLIWLAIGITLAMLFMFAFGGLALLAGAASSY